MEEKFYSCTTIIPIWIFYTTVKYIIEYYDYLKYIRSQKRLYSVTSFTFSDPIYGQLGDTTAWKRFAITGASQKAAAVYNKEDEVETYDYKFDSTKRLLTFISPSDTCERYLFTYSNPTKNEMLLTGKWKNKRVKINLNKVDIDSFVLVKDKTQWMYAAGVTP